MISADELRAAMPFSYGRAGVFCDPLNAAMREFEINTPQREAAFLAQIAHESGELQYVEEIASGEAYEDRADLGNRNPEAIAMAQRHGSTPGRYFKGHCLIEITGYDNHMECADALGVPREKIVDYLKTIEGACRGAGWFWRSRGLNELADSGNFREITHRINGGYSHYSERVAYYTRLQDLLG